MKKINIYRLSVVIFTLVLIVSAVTYAKITQSEIAAQVLRLHVIANSDSESDQRLKIAVRNRILSEAADLFENTSSAAEAAKVAEEKLEYLTEIARDEVKKQGFSYPVSVKIGKVAFPVKFYDDIMLPSGQYTALQITIGDGEGRNWWCVMYPPMCSLDGITSDNSRSTLKDALSENDFNMVSSNGKGAQIRFKIVDLINSVF